MREREREHHMIWHYRENRVLRTRCEGETTVSLIIIIILIINNGVRYYAGSFMKNDLSQFTIAKARERDRSSYFGAVSPFILPSSGAYVTDLCWSIT